MPACLLACDARGRSDDQRGSGGRWRLERPSVADWSSAQLQVCQCTRGSRLLSLASVMWDARTTRTSPKSNPIPATHIGGYHEAVRCRPSHSRFLFTREVAKGGVQSTGKSLNGNRTQSCHHPLQRRLRRQREYLRPQTFSMSLLCLRRCRHLPPVMQPSSTGARRQA